MKPEEVPWDALFAEAGRVRARAHAPYSRFPVGAAALFEDGAVASGCNVENASYGLTLCAERSAVAQGIAAGGRRLLALALVADTQAPCPPCGMCRQVIAEFASGELPIRSRTPQGAEARYTLAELLPHVFTRDFL